MHRIRVPQVPLLELLDSLEAKIAAMRLQNAAPRLPAASSQQTPRSDGRPRHKPIHPFLNIEEL
jgi:hypothetical protein